MGKGKLTEGEQVLQDWAKEYLNSEISLLNDLSIAPTARPWQALAVRITEAIRAAEQRGRDYRQKIKHIGETAEHGPFWEQFYLRVLDMPGVRESLDIGPGTECAWNEIIRVRFGKAKLRSVDPSEIIAYFENQAVYLNAPGFETYKDKVVEMKAAAQECRQIIIDLAAPSEPSTFRPPWECSQ